MMQQTPKPEAQFTDASPFRSEHSLEVMQIPLIPAVVAVSVGHSSLGKLTTENTDSMPEFKFFSVFQANRRDSMLTWRLFDQFSCDKSPEKQRQTQAQIHFETLLFYHQRNVQLDKAMLATQSSPNKTIAVRG